MSENTGVPVRELALDLLLEMEKGQEYSNLLIKNVLDKYDYMGQRDKAFLKRLVEGVTERKIQLDYVLDHYSSVPVRKMKPVIRTLLRMGTYQLLFMEGVPASAACNETVKLAVKRHFKQLKGFVNGVLRTISRQDEQIPWPDSEKEPVRYLSVTYSMPEWIVEKWIGAYGQTVTETILRGLLARRPVTIRLSERLTEEGREELLDALRACGSGPKQHPLLNYAYTLEKSESIARLPGFDRGDFAVQDASSMLVAEAAGLKEIACRNGQELLFLMDVCAAPGGKAVHAAECLGERGSVLAGDISEYKAAYIRENAERMGLTNLTVRVWDAAVLDEDRKESADVVLADLPCSGLGVIGRKADIKYRVSPESIEEVAALQRKILETVWQYVKPGGILVYSTCTIAEEENERNAEWFLENFPFEPVMPAGAAADLCGSKTSDSQSAFPCWIQLLPGVHPTDGFFISCFRRREDSASKCGTEQIKKLP